ncbi:MAG: acetylglutamate kinase [Bacteroidetes bacterium]|jgi:acetylglutamate kinase|nr:acetylglutamate kinase [Bacteroidota bacterium]
MARPAVKETLYLVYLDRYHSGDEIFINNLAQQMHQAPAGDPLCLLVHGSGEKVERTLESQGFFPERTGGVLDVTEPEQVRLVERAVRETNQKVVAMLTDEVVPAVGIQGVDRNLLQLKDGAVTARKAGWVEALLKQRVVPVVSALVRHPEEGRVREVAAADALVALAQSFDALAPRAVFFTTGTQPGLADATGIRDAVSLDALPDDGPLPEPNAVRQIVGNGVPGLITTLEGLFADPGPAGTQVQP